MNQSSQPPSTEAKSQNGHLGKGILIGAALVAGAHAMGVLDPSDRYPLRVEYELASACINGSGGRLSYSNYLDKQERCLCTLEATTKKISYDTYNNSPKDFASAFQEFSSKCGNKGRS